MLDSLKDRIGEELKALWAKLLETQAVQDSLEQFSAWPLAVQRAVAGTIVVVFGYFLLQLPMGFIDSANEQLEQFKADHDSIREIYRIESYRPALAQLSSTDAANLQSQVDSRIGPIQPEQKLGNEPFDGNAKEERPNPKFRALSLQGLRVRLAKLNLNQVLSVGRSLNDIPSAKLLNLEIKASPEDNHYFDVAYGLVSFNVKAEPEKAGGRK